jgi:hypothetical protein
VSHRGGHDPEDLDRWEQFLVDVERNGNATKVKLLIRNDLS